MQSFKRYLSWEAGPELAMGKAPFPDPGASGHLNDCGTFTSPSAPREGCAARGGEVRTAQLVPGPRPGREWVRGCGRPVPPAPPTPQAGQEAGRGGGMAACAGPASSCVSGHDRAAGWPAKTQGRRHGKCDFLPCGREVGRGGREGGGPRRPRPGEGQLGRRHAGKAH